MDSAPAPLLRPLLVAALAGALCGGCGKEDAADPGAAMPRPAGGPSDVTGTNIDIHLTAQGEVRVPLGADKYRISILSPKPDGTFTTIGATVGNDGTFRATDVPAGTYYLRYDFPDDPAAWFLVTDKATHEFGALFAGRPDARAPTAPTSMTFELDGLRPWRKESATDFSDSYVPGDDLWMYSLNAGCLFEVDPDFSTDVPPPPNLLKDGDTRLGGFTVDLSLVGGSLIDAAKGDTALVLQAVHTREGPLRSQRIVRAFSPAPFSQNEGQAVTVSGVMQEAPQRTASLTWNQAAFAALVREVGPRARATRHELQVEPEPAGAGRSSIAWIPSVLRMSVAADGAQDRTIPLAFGNPFPAEWPLVAWATMDVDADDTGVISGRITVGGPFERLLRAPVAPIIGPPRDVRLNGIAAAQGASGTGRTPTIEWKPPALGTATGYEVVIDRVISEDGQPPRGSELAAFATTQTSLRVPPDIIGNDRFVVTVRAYRNDGPAGLWGSAIAISGPLTP